LRATKSVSLFNSTIAPVAPSGATRAMILPSDAVRPARDSPREIPEEALLGRIEAEVARLPGPERAIFNLHVPPKDSQLDKAALLNPDLSPVMSGGAPVIAGVGSTAVRTAIERHQPPLALHGHIHESRGAVRIGRTLSINPGSEYNDGILRGVIVTLSEKGLKHHQLLAG